LADLGKEARRVCLSREAAGTICLGLCRQGATADKKFILVTGSGLFETARGECIVGSDGSVRFREPEITYGLTNDHQEWIHQLGAVRMYDGTVVFSLGPPKPVKWTPGLLELLKAPDETMMKREVSSMRPPAGTNHQYFALPGF